VLVGVVPVEVVDVDPLGLAASALPPPATNAAETAIASADLDSFTEAPPFMGSLSVNRRGVTAR
jgi:hypothetical protein